MLDVVQEDSNQHDSRSSLENGDEDKRDPNSKEISEKCTNWKEFFSKDEIENAVIESKKPIKKENKTNKLTKSQANAKFMKEQVESDSEPSCDNFDEEELAEMFQVAVSDDEMDTLKPSAIKKKKEMELKPFQKNVSPTRGEKQLGGMRPKEYNSIVERI